MDVAHVGLVHRDPCECKVKDFPAVSSIEGNESKRRHLQGVRQIYSHRTYISSTISLQLVPFPCETLKMLILHFNSFRAEREFVVEFDVTLWRCDVYSLARLGAEFWLMW